MANNELDTGVGGFVIDEPGIKNPGVYTFDVGSSSRTGDANYPVREVGQHGGNVNVDHTPKDISPATKSTLADYLGKKTSTNYYKVDGDEGYKISRISGENNTTPPIPAPRETTRNSTWFTQGKDNIGGVTPQSPNLSLRGWMTTPTTQDTPEGVLKEVISKGKEGGAIAGAYNGNDLLSKIDTPDPAAPADELPFLGKISKYQNVVLSNNRFAMTAERSKSFDSDSLVKKSSKRNVEGVSSTTDSATGETNDQYNPTFYHPKYGEITAGRLAQVGTALSLRASGEFTKASEAANDPNVVQTSWLAKQLTAQKIDLVELEVDRIIKELKEEDLREVFYASISDNSSWGNINNVLVQNAGWSSMAMAALAIAMSAGIGVIIGVFFNLILNNITALTGRNSNVNDSGRLTLGSSTSKNEASDEVFKFFSNLIGMVPTTFSYSESVGKGNAVYFGLDGGGITNFLSTAVLNTVRASGQIVPTSRAIIRSSVSVYDNFAEAFSPGLGGFNLDRITRLLAALESIGRSKLMAALNMFATIGDAVLTGEDNKRKSEASRIESTVDVHAGRVSEKDVKLTWSSNRAPSLYLVPPSVSALAAGFELRSLNLSDASARKSYIVDRDKRAGRSNEPILTRAEIETNLKNGLGILVNEMEDILGSEYMPFYFHDIRTNEIIAFHAFIDSLSDDYTAGYDSVEGIGRVEPVKIYKGTQRKIGMSFFIVATDPGDFNDMWEKINKLTTLVYPQYTEGRRHKSGNKYEFIQPFSQLVGASPLIRIRLGNLFRSNYSKFALARLFGAELKDTRFNEENKEKEKEFQSSNSKNLIPLKERISREKKVGAVLRLRADRAVTKGLEVSAEPNKAKRVQDYIVLPFDCDVKIESIGNTAQDITYGEVTFLKPNRKLTKEEIPYFQNERSETYLLRHKFGANISALDLPESQQKRVLQEHDREAQEASGKTQKQIDDYYQEQADRLDGINKFMSVENNALVKSFKSASGKGLAGVIESMSFDWYTNVTWDVDVTKKAPKMCKVTISFTPMHDISPGIDSNGYNRAPIYPGDSNDNDGTLRDKNPLPSPQLPPPTTVGGPVDVDLG
jgi:hypothetical protein